MNAPDSAVSASTISVGEATYIARKSPDTIARWAKQHGIGRQLHPHAPWRIDPVGLSIVLAGDAEALEAYKAGKRQAPELAPYLQGRAA